MSAFGVDVTLSVLVTVDRKKFNKKFMREFRESFYAFDTIEEHVEHLAQLHARGIADNGSFIEGYGPAKDMGIKFSIVAQAQEITVHPSRQRIRP